MKKAKLSCAKLAKLLIARVLVCAAIKRYCVDKQLESLARNRERTGHVYPQQKSGLLDFRRELSAATRRRELSAATRRRELSAATRRRELSVATRRRELSAGTAGLAEGEGMCYNLREDWYAASSRRFYHGKNCRTLSALHQN